MAYVRSSIEDAELHARYCRAVAGGIEWPSNDFKPRRPEHSGPQLPGHASEDHQRDSGVRVLQEDVKLSKRSLHLGGRILSVSGTAKGALARKLEEISDTVNRSLGAAALTVEQTRNSHFVLFVSSDGGGTLSKGRVVACAIVERISQAFRVIDAGQDSSDCQTMDFGTSSDGGIRCSSVPLPAMLGVHRIWTSPAYRQYGVASHLLLAIAENSIYGLTFTKDGTLPYKDSIAFSQPSSAGQRLFTAFTGTPNFLVFVD